MRLNSQIVLVCSTCELVVHQHDNVRVRVDQIRSKITVSHIHKHLSPLVTALDTVKIVDELRVIIRTLP